MVFYLISSFMSSFYRQCIRILQPVRSQTTLFVWLIVYTIIAILIDFGTIYLSKNMIDAIT